MSGLRRIINNTLISLFGQVVTWTSTLLLTIAYGRFLGDVKFGELFFAITFVSLVGFPIEFGFNQQLTRDVAEDPQKSQMYLWNTLLIKVMLWMLLYSVVLFLAWALGYGPEQRSVVAICGITLLSGAIVNTFAALHYAFERTFFPSVGMMLEKGLGACVGFILLQNGATVQTMAFVLLGGSLIDAIWVAAWFFRLTGWHFAIQKAIIRQLVHNSVPFVVYGVLSVIYYRIDTVLLSLMTSTAVVGWYGAAYRLFDTLLFIPNLIINAVMYPIFSKLAVSSESALKMAVEKCMNLLLICAAPIAALMIVAAPNIIGFLYHQAEFANAAPVLQALAPGLVFLYINTLFNSLILSTKGEKKIPIMAAIALVFNLGLNLLLIPIYQQTAAALVTSLTELLLLCISALFVPKDLLPVRSLKVAGKILVAALVMALTIFLLRALSIFIIVPVSLLVYAGVVLLLETIPREDMLSLYQAIRHSNKGEAISTENLAHIADENIYMQITDHLPALMEKKVQPEIRDELEVILEEIADENIYMQITNHLPAIRVRSVQPEVRVEPEVIVEDIDATVRLPARKPRKVKRPPRFKSSLDK